MATDTQVKVYHGAFSKKNLACHGLPKHVLVERPFEVSISGEDQGRLVSEGCTVDLIEDGLETLIEPLEADPSMLGEQVAEWVSERYKTLVSGYCNMPTTEDKAAIRGILWAKIKSMHSILVPEKVWLARVINFSDNKVIMAVVANYVGDKHIRDYREDHIESRLMKADFLRANLGSLLKEPLAPNENRLVMYVNFPMEKDGRQMGNGEYSLVWAPDGNGSVPAVRA